MIRVRGDEFLKLQGRKPARRNLNSLAVGVAVVIFGFAANAFAVGNNNTCSVDGGPNIEDGRSCSKSEVLNEESPLKLPTPGKIVFRTGAIYNGDLNRVIGADIDVTRLESQTSCQRPKSRGKAVFKKLKFHYDAEQRAERILGLYWDTHKIFYEADLFEGCLTDFSITIEVQPHISLHSNLRTKMQECARRSVFDHENIHAGIARDWYKKAARELGVIATRLFTGKRVPDLEDAWGAINPKVGEYMVKFYKNLRQVQDRFHKKLTSREIIREGCRLRKWRR